MNITENLLPRNIEGESLQAKTMWVKITQDRAAEMIRAETELGILEATIDGFSSDQVIDTLKAIREARRRFAPFVIASWPEDTPDA